MNVITTPEGTRDRLFAECKDLRNAQSKLTKLFRGKGYEEISTPEIEYYDLFLQSGNPIPQEALLKIVDRSGKLMVMRPDCTAPIARVACTKLKSAPLPQRLYYNETVFRSGAAHRGGSSEIPQCGIELLGAGGIQADVEAVSVAVEALAAVCPQGFRIELGHAGLFRSLSEQMEMPKAKIEEMRMIVSY